MELKKKNFKLNIINYMSQWIQGTLLEYTLGIEFGPKVSSHEGALDSQAVGSANLVMIRFRESFFVCVKFQQTMLKLNDKQRHSQRSL